MYKTHTGDEDNRLRGGVGLRGLRNLGNTCYINSVIQALSHANVLNDLRDLNTKHPLIIELSHLLETLWSQSSLSASRWDDVNPIHFKAALDRELPQFRGYEQHDSQEFLVALIDILIESRNTPQRQEVVPDTCGPVSCRPTAYSRSSAAASGGGGHSSGSSSKPALYCQVTDINSSTLAKTPEEMLWQEQWSVYKLRYTKSKMTKMFQGFGATRIQCMTCSEINIKMEPITSVLSVPVITPNYECITTCSDAIAEYLEPEILQGDEAWMCPNCKCKRPAKKCMYVYKWPRIVVLHLKKFTWSPQRGFSKIMHQVSLDYDANPMTSGYYIDLPRKFWSRSRYDLFAVVKHQGSYEGGHYQAECFHSMTRSWYEFCDSNVSKISDHTTVVDPSSYLLFFRKNNHQDSRGGRYSTNRLPPPYLDQPRIYMRKERSCTSLQQPTHEEAGDDDDDDDIQRPQSEEPDSPKYTDQYHQQPITNKRLSAVHSTTRRNPIFPTSINPNKYRNPFQPDGF